MRRASRIAIVAAALLVAQAAGIRSAEDPVVVETEHYRIEAGFPAGEVEEMGRVLEAAWPQFAAFFGAEPTLAGDERLRVFVGATKEAFEARMRADGVTPPEAGGYYSPGNSTAYLYRQPTIYYTRVLLLHEATHQFHYRACTKNRHISHPWYVEGLAEHLGRHCWDGETLVIGALPVLSLADYAAAAKAKLDAANGDLRGFLEEGYDARPVYWALVRYLLLGEGGRNATKFRALMKRLDRGEIGRDIVFRTFGRSAPLGRKLSEWLAGEQEPWMQIYNEWEGTAPGRFRGTAPGAIVSLCRAKADLVRLRATLEVPGSGAWIGGLLLHHVDNGNYSTAMVYGTSEIRVVKREGDHWVTLATAALPEPKEPGLLRFEAVRQGGKVTLMVEGAEIGGFELPGSKLGLALQGSTLKFRDVSWEEAR